MQEMKTNHGQGRAVTAMDVKKSNSFEMKSSNSISIGQTTTDMGFEKSSSFEKMLSKIVDRTKSEAASIQDEMTGMEANSAEEMKDELSGIDFTRLEKILRFIKAFYELDEEESSLLEQMASSLQKLQDRGEESILAILDLASSNLLKEILIKHKQLDLAVESGIDVEEFKIIPLEQLQLAKDPEAEKLTAEKIISEIQLPGKYIKSIDYNELQKQAEQVYVKVEALLKQVEEKADITRIAPKILELLSDWQKISQAGQGNTSLFTTLNAENKQLLNIWQELVQTFQNRTGMNQRNMYQLDAKISTSDIVRWLSRAMEAELQPRIEKMTTQPAASPTMPISKVEQFVIHMNQTHSSPSPDKQLMEQFQKIMDANRITNLQNTRGNLAITLKPANLGEMLVKFTQVDGEMLVKILVTSDAAKEMLKGNIQQLRNMFSPHQVVIEKQESVIPQNQAAQNEQSNMEEHEQMEEQKHSKSQQNQAEDESFSSIFEELVLNEKV